MTPPSSIAIHSNNGWFDRTFTPRIAAYTAVVLFLIMAIIQLLIAAAVLPVTWVWRSGFDHLTLQLRLGSVAAALILMTFAWIVWYRYQYPQQACQNWPSFLVTSYMMLNTVGNWLSPNRVERYGFGTLTLILAICCFRVSTTHHTSPSSSSTSSTGEETEVLLNNQIGETQSATTKQANSSTT